jgi:DnaJ-class molecular chaperone
MNSFVYKFFKRNYFHRTHRLSVKDYYRKIIYIIFSEILGLNSLSNDNDIKRAYFKLAKIYHPDVNRSVLAKERFSEINEVTSYNNKGI